MTIAQSLIAERIEALIDQLSYGIYERRDAIRLCLLAALSGESVFLIGPPGIAKSLMAKRMIKIFEDESYFEYLMTRFSTPEEIFGPLSIKALKDEGKYIRLTEGYLPKAKVVFLDEIWKAGPAILNTLLTVINERTFHNGVEHETVPMRVLVAASNELPSADAGLEALYDRMLLRLYLEPIQDKRNFKAMLIQKPMSNLASDVKKVSNEEFELWQKKINDVTLSDRCFELIYELKLFLEQKNTSGEMIDAAIYVSDRRWKKSMRLLQACAYFNGRSEVSETDLFILKDCIWHDLESRAAITEAIGEFARQRFCDQQQVTQKIKKLGSKLINLDNDFKDRFSTRLVSEMMLTKVRYKVDAQSIKIESINGLPGMCKLAIIGEYDILEEGSTEKAQWIHVGLEDFQKQIKTGSCLVKGYVNDSVKSVWLSFSVNENQHLHVHNFSNQAIPVAIVQHNAVLNITENWIKPLETAVQEVQQIQTNIIKNQHDFSAMNKNIFVGDHYIENVAKSLGALTLQLNQIKQQKESLKTRLHETAKVFLQEVVSEK